MAPGSTSAVLSSVKDAKALQLSLRIPYFRIFYSSSYIVLFLILIVLLAATPAEFLYQIISNDKLGNVFVVGATYIVTAAIALFIYSGRLYTNRATLAAIPRPYLPIEKDEVSRRVRRVIVQNRQRSALVAFESRPRHIIPTTLDGEEKTSISSRRSFIDPTTTRLRNIQNNTLVQISASDPPWGQIWHPGWSSPSSEDIPSLEFQTVFKELPNLIEAKVVALESSRQNLRRDSEFVDDNESILKLDLVQRPANMGLRDYLTRLGQANVVISPQLVSDFLAKYETARFARVSTSESAFRSLMDSFSSLLSSIELDETADYASSVTSGSSASNTSILQSVLIQTTSDEPLIQDQQEDTSPETPMSIVHHGPSTSQGALSSPSQESLGSVIIHHIG